MKRFIQLMLVASLTVALAGCFDNNNNSNNNNLGSAASFTAKLTAIEVANTDTGEQVEVGGLPAEGDEIIKD